MMKNWNHRDESIPKLNKGVEGDLLSLGLYWKQPFTGGMETLKITKYNRIFYKDNMPQINIL